MPQTSVINDLLNAISDTGLFGERRRRRPGRDALKDMIDAVLSGRGEASSIERGAEFLRTYRDLDYAGRTFVFRTLAADYGPDPDRLTEAAAAYVEAPDQTAAKALQKAAEPKRVELFRRLNHVQGGTQALVAMRCELTERVKNHPELWLVDDDMRRLFNAWFNRGFLELRQISWQTSAAILEKIIRYEAVHAINGWDDLRLRIDVPDRRLFAFFHPRLEDEPLIFVEVALTDEVPTAIAPILAPKRDYLDPSKANTAAFYSINNCQDGLRGISFGSFLIKQVASDLAKELPDLKTFVTLSPMPGFAGWLAAEAERSPSAVDEGARAILQKLGGAESLEDPSEAKGIEASLLPLAAHYLSVARDKKGRMADPVARFHLGNGARLEQINFAADLSQNGWAASHGMMVNYRYVLADVEANHEAFVADGRVAATTAVQRLARSVRLEKRGAMSESEPLQIAHQTPEQPHAAEGPNNEPENEKADA
ncbi:MAG: malonyl-CoA decarboxylase [Pseudomonadota bacterium]